MECEICGEEVPFNTDRCPACGERVDEFFLSKISRLKERALERPAEDATPVEEERAMRLKGIRMFAARHRNKREQGKVEWK